MPSMTRIAHFFGYVLKILDEQGISVDELLQGYAQSHSVTPAVQRDLVDELRELGHQAVQPDIPEGKVAESAAERQARADKAAADAAAAETK